MTAGKRIRRQLHSFITCRLKLGAGLRGGVTGRMPRRITMKYNHKEFSNTLL